MTLASANRTNVRFVKETEVGVIPAAAAGQALRYTGESFAYNKETVTSNELRQDTRNSDVTHVGSTSGGGLDIELSMTSFDELYRAALCSNFSTPIDVTDTISVTGATNTYTSTAAAFTNAQLGQYLYFTGFSTAANNGWKRVVTKADNDTITVSSETTLVDEAGTGDEVVQGKMLRDGTTLDSYTFEVVRDDVSKFFAYKGQHVNGFGLDLQNKSIATGNFSLVGRGVSDASSSHFSSTTAATTTPVVNTTHNVGSILLDGVPVSTALRSISLDYTRNLEAQPALGEEFPVGYRLGTQAGTGSVTAYFEDLTLYNLFKNHTYFSLSFALKDADGKAIRITMDKVVFKTDNAPASGKDTDVIETIEYESMHSDTYDCQIQIDIV